MLYKFHVYDSMGFYLGQIVIANNNNTGFPWKYLWEEEKIDLTSELSAGECRWV